MSTEPRAIRQTQLRAFYEVLYATWGQQHWWPAQGPFEVIVGTYLTQNTSWRNVELALAQLRKARILSIKGIREVSLRKLEQLIRPAGYFRQKAQRLKLFVRFLDRQYGGSLARMFGQPTDPLRKELLQLTGIGQETADSILLYAGQHPTFVVDAYTRRVLERHGILSADTSYEEIRELCQSALADWDGPTNCIPQQIPRENAAGTCHRPSRMSKAKRSLTAQTYNEMHGLIVRVAKHYCLKSNPQCERCPLRDFLPKEQASYAS